MVGQFSLWASEVKGVRPLTERIIVVHFDDGFIRHHELGEPRNMEWAIVDPLDVVQAMATASYRIGSPDDPNYSDGVAPVLLHRKSKATDVSWLCQGWTGSGCINDDPDHAKEHWIYLLLDEPMQSGKTYELLFPGLPGLAPQAFVYNDRAHRSDAVHVNQLGYVPLAGEKYGYVYHWLGDGGELDLSAYEGNTFHLVDTGTGDTEYTGTLNFRKPIDNQEFAYPFQAPPYGNLVGVSVYDCDFSDFNEPGEYRLCVDGVGCSYPFAINDDIYHEPTAAIMGGLYQQRSGIATVEPYTSQPRPAPHNPLLTPGFAGQLQYSTFRYPDFSDNDAPAEDREAIENALLGPLDVAGWYQDAGDWDSYFSHTDVPTMLLWLYEMGGDRFGDNQYLIPESGNGLPDLLDEALWLPHFHYRLRQELLDKGYGTGGIGGGRIFGDLWGDDVLEDGTTIGSWQDTSRLWVCTGEDPFMSYKYAGLAAHIAYLMELNELTDPEGIDWEAEARATYEWAEANTLPGDVNLLGNPFLYQCELFAAANMYRLTGEEPYQADFIDAFDDISTDDPINVELIFGLSAYLATNGIHPLNSSVQQAALAKLEGEADFHLLDTRDDRACRWGGNFFLQMLIGQPTTPLVLSGVMGHYFLKDSNPDKANAYRDALYSTADYFLGNNPLNMCWITGVGDNNPQELLCLDSWYIGGDTPRQGIVPYGPWEAANFYGDLGPWNHLWAFEFIWPEDKDLWPAHERWFEQRTAAATNEYTVQQNLAPPIFTYGYLYTLTAEAFVDSNIETPANQLTLTLFPNPTKDRLQIKGVPAGDYQLVLYDANGAVQRNETWRGEWLDVRDLPAGVYWVCLTGDEGERWCGEGVIW